ncbi:MAG: hypothetical protein AAF821_20875 [Cyanobacteria bacterium P01_D01_bin.156]
MTGTLTNLLEITSKINLPTVEAFVKRHGEAHFLFACHAALPLGLTPELLYKLWANFQVDCRGKQLGIPWIATSDLLLSNLCEEVGDGLYEMNSLVREALLDFLENHECLNLKRIQELAAFMATHVQSQLKSENLDIQDFAKAQNWLSIAYLQPEKAVKELAANLADAFQEKSDDLLRIASIVRALERPLINYPDLLTYARGMENYAQGNIEDAQKEFDKIRQSNNLHHSLNKGLPLPHSSSQKVQIEQRNKQINLPLTAQILASITLGSVISGSFWLLQIQRPIEAVLTEPSIIASTDLDDSSKVTTAIHEGLTTSEAPFLENAEKISAPPKPQIEPQNEVVKQDKPLKESQDEVIDQEIPSEEPDEITTSSQTQVESQDGVINSEISLPESDDEVNNSQPILESQDRESSGETSTFTSTQLSSNDVEGNPGINNADNDIDNGALPSDETAESVPSQNTQSFGDDNSFPNESRAPNPISGGFSLVALTNSTGGNLDENLQIRIPRHDDSSPLFLMRELSARYQLDEVPFTIQDNFHTYSLPTRSLVQLGVNNINQLRPLAFTNSPQRIAVPTILGQASDSYRFIFHSSAPSRFLEVSIRSNDDGRIYVTERSQTLQTGEYIFVWPGVRSFPAGRYTFSYKVEVEMERNSSPIRIARSFIFEHDPSLLR